MNGVAGLGEIKFDVGHFQFKVVVNSRADHIKTIEFVKQSLAGLEWVLRRNNEPDFFEVGGLRHDVGNDQVPGMNWIE